MKKSAFKRLVNLLTLKNKRKNKSDQFARLADNAPGSKMIRKSHTTSRRGCDGTMRR